MPSGHTLSLSALTVIIIIILQNCLQICETKSKDILDNNLDLIYSDSSQGPQTAAAHQQVVYIDHGGGATSHIRRTSFFPIPSVPSLPFRPNVDHYPNTFYENNNIVEDPYVNFPQDIPRLYERRDGPNQEPNHLGLQSPPSVPFNHQNGPQQPITPELHQQIPPIPQQLPPPFHQSDLHQINYQGPQSLQQPILQALPQPYPYHISQPIQHQFPQPFGHQLSQPYSQPIHTSFHQPISQPLPQPILESIPQQIVPPDTNSLPKSFRHPIDDIEDERFLIHNEIERIPKPSNQIKPTKREPPPPPPPPIQEPPIDSFFNFNSPEIFGGIDGGFDPFGRVGPVFQRRRLTTNTNNNAPDVSQNSIGGYPPYAYYKGDDSPKATNWPKIFKFTDGRSNLYDFEKQKKQNKIKFTSKETYFDNISRDSFLILHGGTYAQ